MNAALSTEQTRYTIAYMRKPVWCNGTKPAVLSASVTVASVLDADC